MRGEGERKESEDKGLERGIYSNTTYWVEGERSTDYRSLDSDWNWQRQTGSWQ